MKQFCLKLEILQKFLTSKKGWIAQVAQKPIIPTQLSAQCTDNFRPTNMKVNLQHWLLWWKKIFLIIWQYFYFYESTLTLRVKTFMINVDCEHKKRLVITSWWTQVHVLRAETWPIGERSCHPLCYYQEWINSNLNLGSTYKEVFNKNDKS